MLSLPFADYSNGYLVKELDGLDPVKASLVSSTMAQVDGAQAQAASRGTRNITGKIGLRPNYITTDVPSLRMNLYSWLMPKQLVTMNFYMDDALFATTKGIVESCENNMFSADPEVDFSIICYDPDFYAVNDVQIAGSTVTDTSAQQIVYGGTSDAGVIFTLNVNNTIPGFTLYNTRPDGTIQKYEVDGTFQAGDIVTVTTIPLQKSLILNRSNEISSILYFLQNSRDWISLGKGINEFRAFCSAGSVPWTMTYRPKYGGF